jgi:methyl-accepting chemotaxis protein
MRLVRSFLGSLLVPFAVANALCWIVAHAVFPLDAAQLTVLRYGILVALPLEVLVAAGAVHVVAAPLRRAFAAGAPVPAPLAARAASAATWLPLWTSVVTLGAALAATFAVVARLAEVGLPVDLAWAGACVGFASAVLAAMLAHSFAAIAAAPMIESFGGASRGALRGTVRGKILALGFGLNTIGLLLLAATGYVRQTAELDRWTSLAWISLAVYAATALLAWVAARAITFPFGTLGRAAERIASGDLTATAPASSRDEMGQLAVDFGRMANGLKALVVDVQSASAQVSAGAREAGAIGQRVRSGALSQHAGVAAMAAAVEAMEGSIAQVARGVGGLSEYVSATTQAFAEMASAYEDIRTKGTELDQAMDAAIRDVEHLGAAGRDAESTLGELEDLASHAGGTLAAVKGSMAGLERAASESEATATAVAEMAQRAGGVVEETVHGIDTLRAAVSDAHRRIGVLGRRSDDIDHVVDFISEVAGRTNLLSLNASIIAAQAGGHGKAFSVVADQIRELATQIARSTKSIGDIIHAVREDVEATAALIDRGDALAGEGVQLARNSLEALSKIQRSTAHGIETAGGIRAAVDAHGQSAREVSQLVQSVADGSRAVTQAVQLVGRSVTGVNVVARTVNAMADQVARALGEQAGLGRRQQESLARLERMIGEITRAVENHSVATRRVRESLQSLSQSTGAHESAVEGLSGVADQLGSRARALADRVHRFKV